MAPHPSINLKRRHVKTWFCCAVECLLVNCHFLRAQSKFAPFDPVSVYWISIPIFRCSCSSSPKPITSPIAMFSTYSQVRHFSACSPSLPRLKMGEGFCQPSLPRPDRKVCVLMTSNLSANQFTYEPRFKVSSMASLLQRLVG